ncbi:MAG: terpene cyclase/mutase family protein [Planctomycetota bacterium]|nr:terpene cyclase/mutase family protein [Planctomycetota bacterium]
MVRLLAFAVLALLPGSSLAVLAGEAEGEGTSGESGFVEIEPRQDQAIEKGLNWLSKNQGRDGAWGSAGSGGQYRMAMTSLAGLAFLAAGQTPGRGKYGRTVEQAIDFILKHQGRDGLFGANDGQEMYGHGFAMTFLAEACGMTPASEVPPNLKDALDRAVKLTARAQSSWGGWYYSPNSGSDEGSVTITQVQALRACANIGINVPDRTMKQSLSYIHKSQNSDGSVRYTARSAGGGSVALTAAGAELLMMAGQYNTPETQKAVEYLKRNLDPDRSRGYHDFYTNFYGAQAMSQVGGAAWAKYYTKLRSRLISSQDAAGSWSGDIGTTYSTSIAVMILSIPYQYLPIWQK